MKNFLHVLSRFTLPLALAAVAVLLNLWLGFRVGQLRTSQKVLHGDGGVPAVARRMRAHANFIEYTPLVLILFALVELAWGSPTWLWIVAVLYIFGRILHPLGMDHDRPHKARMIGIVLTYLVMILLAIMALISVYRWSSGQEPSVFDVGPYQRTAQATDGKVS